MKRLSSFNTITTPAILLPTILTLTVLLLSTLTTSAQTDTLYIDGANHYTTHPYQAEIMRVRTKSGSGWTFTDRSMKGVLKMTGAWSDSEEKIAEGEYKMYDESGKLHIITHYVNNKEQGKYQVFYENGQLHADGNKRNGRIEGDWKAYYRDGAVAATAVFDTGHQVTATFYKTNGSPDTAQRKFFKGASFPGGLKSLFAYLNRSVRYPPQALKKRIDGKVMVDFIVTSEGDIKDAHVSLSIDPLLDEEALRVVNTMPKWEPAEIGGIATDSRYKQPVTFRIQQ